MNGTLYYVVGPSGAGKDALLDYARVRLPKGVDVRFARRWITRGAGSAGENHLPVSHEEFARMAAAGRFAMQWSANGNRYGIGCEIRDWLKEGATVVVSGSREYLPQALKNFPELKVISITVSPEALRGRLERRGRETAREIETRIKRAARFALPAGVASIDIANNNSLDAAGEVMLAALVGRSG
jgi:ribose 1,5-bisphosphokinase